MELRSVAYNPTPAPGMGGMMPGMQDMQGMQSGMQGMQPGMQGMQPGMQGMQPGMQGMQPGMQGMHPEMQGMSEMERMLHGMHGVPGMYQHLDMDPCCPLPCPCPAYETHHCPMPAPGPAPTPAPEVYVVKKGDTIYKIAKRHGTTMQAIILANNLRNPNLIYPGQILLIPAASTADFRG